MRARPKVYWLVLLTIVASFFLLVLCRPTAGYLGFMSQSKRYYSRFADGCEKLRSHEPTIGVATARKLATETDLLAPEIKELRPEYIFVTTNGVQIQIGYGQTSYTIDWSKTDDGKSWELSASREGFGHVLYVRTNK